MYLLDTNILSEFMRPHPSEDVVMWLYRQKRRDLYVSVITQAELLRGAYLLDKGKRQANYLTQIKHMIHEGFAEQFYHLAHHVRILMLGFMLSVKSKEELLKMLMHKLLVLHW